MEYTISKVLTNTFTQIYMEETVDSYAYYIGLPGANKNDLDINLLIEEDFITVVVILKKDTIFVDKNIFKIAFLLDDILCENDNDIKVLFDKGVLEIKATKKN